MKRLNQVRPRENIAKRLARLLRSFALVLGASGIVVLGMQAVGWFRDGVWTHPVLLDLWLWLGNSYSISAGNRGSSLELWLLDLPLGPALIGAGLVLLLLARGFAK